MVLISSFYSRVNEVATVLVVGIQNFERCLFVAFTQSVFPVGYQLFSTEGVEWVGYHTNCHQNSWLPSITDSLWPQLMAPVAGSGQGETWESELARTWTYWMWNVISIWRAMECLCDSVILSWEEIEKGYQNWSESLSYTSLRTRWLLSAGLWWR